MCLLLNLNLKSGRHITLIILHGTSLILIQFYIQAVGAFRTTSNIFTLHTHLALKRVGSFQISEVIMSSLTHGPGTFTHIILVLTHPLHTSFHRADRDMS